MLVLPSCRIAIPQSSEAASFWAIDEKVYATLDVVRLVDLISAPMIGRQNQNGSLFSENALFSLLKGWETAIKALNKLVESLCREKSS